MEQSNEEGSTVQERPARTYGQLVGERSLSPDLVSLSSTSDSSELHSDEEGTQDHQTPPAPGEDPSTVEGSQLSSLSHSSDSNSPHTTGTREARGAGDTRTNRPSESSKSDSPDHLHSLDSEASGGSPMVDSLHRYQLLDKSKLTVSDFESTGLLYARASQTRHNV